jgi:ElaB/YqjD/DUF883 family membrane-anchored ribosome-binding protein
MSEAAAQNTDTGVKDSLESSQDHVRAAASEVRDAAAEAAREVKERANAIAGELKGKVSDWQKDAEQYVRENPTKSVLAAVGVGFVMGLIFRK